MDKGFIVNALRKNGVQEGMYLEVHSSLKSFGYVESGAETVISALKDGHTAYSIAKEIGCAYNTVKNEIRRGSKQIYRSRRLCYRAETGQER